MSDKPSEKSLCKIQLEDLKIVEVHNHIDLASAATVTDEDTKEIGEFDQIMSGIQERMSRVMRRVSLSCAMINQLHHELKAKLPSPSTLRIAEETKQAIADGDDEFKDALEEMTEGTFSLQEIPPEEGVEN